MIYKYNIINILITIKNYIINIFFLRKNKKKYKLFYNIFYLSINYSFI